MDLAKIEAMDIKNITEVLNLRLATHYTFISQNTATEEQFMIPAVRLSFPDL